MNNKSENHWNFGGGIGLNFNGGLPPSIVPSALETMEGCSSVSDSVTGELIFYTNGVNVWDGSNNLVSSGLLGHNTSTHSATIVQDPGNDDRYYIFTAEKDIGGRYVYYSIFDRTLGGIDPSNKNVNAGIQNNSEKLAVVQKPNCTDYWLVAAEATYNNFIVKDLTAQGLGPATIINGGGHEFTKIGYIKISSGRDKLAITNFDGKSVLLYDFDNTTGNITFNHKIETGIITQALPYGVEFSVNGKFLYFSCAFRDYDSMVFQQDLNNLTLTPTLLGTLPPVTGPLPAGRNTPFFGCMALQLSPDKSIILVAIDGGDHLAAIHQPETSAASLIPNYLSLPNNNRCYMGLPSFPQKGGCVSVTIDPNNHECGCTCNGCNKKAEEQNTELNERAKDKYYTAPSNESEHSIVFSEECNEILEIAPADIKLSFHIHWGENVDSHFTELSTKVFYITVCNNYKDIKFKGLRITQVLLDPDIDKEKIQIIPDLFINLDCLEACSCVTREFTMINKSENTHGNYNLKVAYCYEEIILDSPTNEGIATLPVTVVEQ